MPNLGSVFADPSKQTTTRFSTNALGARVPVTGHVVTADASQPGQQMWVPDTAPGYDAGTDPSASMARRVGSLGASAAPPADPNRDAAYAQLANEIRQNTGYTPTPITSPSATPAYTPQADAATYARAKDQTGLQLQGALKGLRNALSGRGIAPGSGLEARGSANLFGQGLETLGQTDRALAEGTAGRAFTAGESARGRDVQVQGMNEQNKQAAQGSALDRLRLLLQTYGAEYGS